MFSLLITMLVFALWASVTAESADEQEGCESNDVGCLLGGDHLMALGFSLRTTQPVTLDSSVDELTPPPLVLADAELIASVDPSGGLLPDRGEYTVPSVYVQEDGTGVDRTYSTLESIEVQITANGFEPANISIPPGTTVIWRVVTFETVSVQAVGMFNQDSNRQIDTDQIMFNSGALNRNWRSSYSHLFADTSLDDVVWRYRDGEASTRLAGLDGPTGSVLIKRQACEVHRLCTTFVPWPVPTARMCRVTHVPYSNVCRI